MGEGRMFVKKEKGQVFVFSAFAIIVAVAFLAFTVWGGRSIRDRIILQNSADSSAMAGASWEAKGLNLLSALNTGMVIAVSIIVVEIMVMIALTSLCFLTWWAGGGACDLIPSWAEFMEKTIPKLWKSAKEMERIGDRIVKFFPFLVIGETLRVASVNPIVSVPVLYPFIPGEFEDPPEGRKVMLHVEKGSFDDIAESTGRFVEKIVSKLSSYAVGDLLGGAIGKVIGLTAGFIGKYAGKAVEGLSKTGSTETENEEEFSLDQSKCGEVWNLVKEITSMDRWGYSSRNTFQGSIPFMWGIEEEKGDWTERERRYEVVFTYRHYQYMLVDVDRNGNGVVSDKDGCIRKWAHFEGHRPGAPFLAKEFSDEIVKYKGEMPSGDIGERGCSALGSERKEVCDGEEYVVEKWEFRRADVKIRTKTKTKPPQELPRPFVLHKDAPSELWITAGVIGEKRVSPLEALFFKEERNFAVAQARPFSPTAVPGEMFTEMDWKVSLMPVTALKEIMKRMGVEGER
jgi:hypothetical protein